MNQYIPFVAGPALGFATAVFWNRLGARNKAADEKKIVAAKIAEELRIAVKVSDEKIQALEKQLATMSQTVVPLTAAFQQLLIEKLTHYHTPEMDALMVKIGPPLLLTVVEEARLLVLLEERTRDLNGRIDNAEREAAVMLPMVMRLVKEEDAKLKKQVPELSVVAKAAPEEKPAPDSAKP